MDLELDVIDLLGAEAGVLEEQVEFPDLIQLQSSSIACLLIAGVKLERVLRQAAASTDQQKEAIKAPRRQVLVLLTESFLQGIHQMLDATWDVLHEDLARDWVLDLLY